MNIVVLVPYRPDNGIRDQAWQHLNQHYWRQVGWPVHVGEHHDGPFNRSLAVNHAADRDWDVAVIADSDTWVPYTQLAQAVTTAQTGVLCAAFTHVAELTEHTTSAILQGRTPTTLGVQRIRVTDMETQSSMLAIGRDLWDRVGGFDTRFHGWGGEDNAFWKSCTLHAGPPERIPGPAYHLWHPPSAGKHRGPDYHNNLALWSRYQRATTIKELP